MPWTLTMEITLLWLNVTNSIISINATSVSCQNDLFLLQIINVTTWDRTVVTQCYELCHINISCQNDWFTWRNAVKPFVLAGYLFVWFVCMTWLIRMCVSGLMHVCDMTHSCVWHDPFGLLVCVICLYDMTGSYVSDMTYSCVWHDLFGTFACMIGLYDMTHSYAWHDTFICVTWHIHMCDMTHSYVWHNTEPVAAYGGSAQWRSQRCEIARFGGL